MKYSKIAHIDLIYEIAKGVVANGGERYLELGIAKARCFNKVAPLFRKSVAVDINPKADEYITGEKNYFFYKCTTDEFYNVCFKDLQFDLIFIDANHRYECVARDLMNSVEHLSEDGIIIVHDTFPPDKESMNHCYDSWRLQEAFYSDSKLQFINLPFYYGLFLVKKSNVKPWWDNAL